MTVSLQSQIRWRLAQLSSHLVVALIALVVVGGATRVMEAGLACPDWPLCFGSFLPGQRMNVQVFLEWFHRLDAFLVGIALFIQFVCSLRWRSSLPYWLPWASAALVILVLSQGLLGALTVFQLLPTGVVTTHLALALILVSSMSGLSQVLLSKGDHYPPIWWRILGSMVLLSVFAQCLLGGRMATGWAAQRCLSSSQECQWLDLHRISAMPVALFVLTFVLTPLFVRGLKRQIPFLFGITFLVITQIGLGISSLNLGLQQPLLTVGHQLVASLLVALLSAVIFMSSDPSVSQDSLMGTKNSMEPCHG